MDTQAKCSYAQYQRLPDALSRNIYLTALHDRNAILFYRLFSEHLREMIPIVNDLTVGKAMEQYQHECRRPTGVYLSIDHVGAIEETFKNLGARPDDIDLILATDAEQIPGIMIGVWAELRSPSAKLAVGSAAGGIDPARVIPVMLDVGTNRESLLKDPMYIGNRHARVRGKRYDNFIEAYVKAAKKLFPNAMLQWADFEPGNGRRILEKYRDQICTFNDDMQGAGRNSRWLPRFPPCACLGRQLRNQRVVIFGAGTVAWASLRSDPRCNDAVRVLSRQEACRRLWCVDVHGLLTDDMGAGLRDYQAPYARPAAEVRQWKREGNAIGLDEVVRRVRPTMLIGASTAGGAFTEAIVRQMAAHTDAAHHLCALEIQPLAGRGHADRSDLVDRGAGADRHRQPVCARAPTRE